MVRKTSMATYTIKELKDLGKIFSILLEQELKDYDSRPKHGLLFDFENKILLEHG